MLYLKNEGCFSLSSLWTQQSLVYIHYQIMSYVLNFLVEVILNLTYGLGCTDQAMSDSPFFM
jgi:hypothetical protein